MVEILITAMWLAASADSLPALTAETIIQNSVAANERDWRAAPQYSYSETVRERGSSKTERVIMLDGSPYHMLLKVNDAPLSPEDQKAEQRKLNRAKEERGFESPRRAEERKENYDRDRRRDHLMMLQLSRAFDFTITGEDRLDDRDVYTLRATPRPGYVPPNTQARVLRGMKGELWIDKQTFQWVKVRAEVVSPVNIAGFVATVEPGTFFELEKRPVEGDIWLPSHFQVKSQSKVLRLFAHNTNEEDTFFDYQKTGVTAR